MPRWDVSSKQRQSELCRQQQPWTKSTGPRSCYGRLTSSRNAKKHRRRFQAARCDMLQEPETLVQALEGIPKYQSDVTVQKTQDIQVGDRALYIGADPAIASICGGKKLEVFAIREGWAICWVTGVAGLISVRVEDLKNATLE